MPAARRSARFRPFSLAALALAGAAVLAPMAPAPAAATDLTHMSDAERSAFRDEVHKYLLDHPEVLMEAIDELQNRQAQAQASADQQLLKKYDAAIYHDGVSWVGGNPDGDVTLVEFMDYRCGYCKQAQPHVLSLLKKDGNIRYIVKEFPILGPQSVMGARFAISVRRLAGGDAYERVHDALMDFRGQISDASLRALAKREGLDADAVMKGMSDPAVDHEIAANNALAQTLKINGTPGFILGDQIVRGYIPADTMARLVERARS